MDLFISTLIAICVVFSGIIGWFSRGRILIAVIICVPLSFLASVAFMIWNHFTVDVAGVVWVAVPFTEYIFTPCLVSGGLMTLVAYLVNRYKSNRK